MKKKKLSALFALKLLQQTFMLYLTDASVVTVYRYIKNIWGLFICVRKKKNNKNLAIRTDIRKTLTPWSSVSMAVIRTLFSLALSTCIWGQSLVLRINRRLPWVLITGRV